jgi:hypothetical protein
LSFFVVNKSAEPVKTAVAMDRCALPILLMAASICHVSTLLKTPDAGSGRMPQHRPRCASVRIGCTADTQPL